MLCLLGVCYVVGWGRETSETHTAFQQQEECSQPCEVQGEETEGFREGRGLFGRKYQGWLHLEGEIQPGS